MMNNAGLEQGIVSSYDNATVWRSDGIIDQMLMGKESS